MFLNALDLSCDRSPFAIGFNPLGFVLRGRSGSDGKLNLDANQRNKIECPNTISDTNSLPRLYKGKILPKIIINQSETETPMTSEIMQMSESVPNSVRKPHHVTEEMKILLKLCQEFDLSKFPCETNERDNGDLDFIEITEETMHEIQAFEAYISNYMTKFE